MSATWQTWHATYPTTTPSRRKRHSTPTRCATTTATRWSTRRRNGSTPEEAETLDERLAEEVPDVGPEDVDPRDADDTATDTVSVSDDQLDRLDPEQHGTERGQIDGTPEDGDSFFDVER